MPDEEQQEIAQALSALSGGTPDAMNRLMPLVYGELRRIAHRQLHAEPAGHTLSTTAVVHEAYLRFADQGDAQWVDRAQFFAVAARIMRRVLVDHARERQAAKRDGGIRITLDNAARVEPPVECEVLMLHDALEALARLDERQAQIVELKYFGGLSEEDVAAVLSLSRATITREWQSARAWLYRRMTKAPRTRS